MTKADTHVKSLIENTVRPLIHRVHTGDVDDAITLWRRLDLTDRETAVTVLAAMVPVERSWRDALRPWTRRRRPEHADEWVESPRPLVVTQAGGETA